LDAEHGARLRVALVGAGLVGQAAHVITLADDRARFDFVAIVDPSPTVRTAVAARYGVPHAVGTLAEAMILDPAHRTPASRLWPQACTCSARSRSSRAWRTPMP
jgi:hypothetical protein